MTKRYFFSSLAAVIFLVAALFAPSTLHAAEEGGSKKIKAEGIARSAEDVTDLEVKGFAVQNALKSAIFSVYESLTSTDLEAPGMNEQKEAVSKNALNYVLDFRVLSEGWLTHMEMGPGSIPPLPLEEEEIPGESGGDTDAGAVEGEPATPPGLVTLAPAVPAPEEMGDQSVRLYHVWVEASVDIVRLRKDALKLSAEIAGKGLDATEMTVMVVGVNDYAEFESIRKTLERVDIVKSVSMDTLRRGRVVLKAEVWGNPHLLLERLGSGDGMDSFDLIPAGPKSIIVRSKGRASR